MKAYTETYIFVVLSILYLIGLSIAIIKRKYKLRQYIISAVLFLATATFIVSMLITVYTEGFLGARVAFFSRIPLGNLFLPFETEEMAREYRPLFYRYFAVTAAFAVFWGFFLPFFQKKPSYRKLMLVSIAIWVPAEAIFWFLCYKGYSEAVFDTGCFIVLLAGFSLGYGLYHLLYGAKRKPAETAKEASV